MNRTHSPRAYVCTLRVHSCIQFDFFHRYMLFIILSYQFQAAEILRRCAATYRLGSRHHWLLGCSSRRSNRSDVGRWRLHRWSKQRSKGQRYQSTCHVPRRGKSGLGEKHDWFSEMTIACSEFLGPDAVTNRHQFLCTHYVLYLQPLDDVHILSH